MLAGGTFERLVRNETVNDLDIYFRSAIDAYKTIKSLIDEKYVIISKTKRSLVLKNKMKTDIPINVIYMKYFNDLEDVFSYFDFECCKAGFDFSNNDFVTSTDFWETISTKILTYTNSLYPIGALCRLTKYVKRGYNPDYASMLRLYRDLKNINIDDLEVLEDQIGGIYGCNISLKGLTLDQIIEKIENASELEKRPTFTNEDEIDDIFEFIFTYKKLLLHNKLYTVCYCGDEMVNITDFPLNTDPNHMEDVKFPLIVGKWVTKKDGLYYSNYNSKFSYYINQVVVPEPNTAGIFTGLKSRKDELFYATSPNPAWCKIMIESAEDIRKLVSATQIVLNRGIVLSIKDKYETFESPSVTEGK
jgi:hypothetical protein